MTNRHTQDFVSEDEIKTFEGWLSKVQGLDISNFTPDELEMWRVSFDDVIERAASTPKVCLMKGLMMLRKVPGEYRYGVAVREEPDLWLTLWIRRSRKGEFFIMIPRGDREWKPHASYHRDGTFHSKSYGHKLGQPTKRQPLSGPFRGAEHLGAHAGHGPRSVGAICDPAAFSGVVDVPSGVLGPRNGVVVVDLVEPGCEPLDAGYDIVKRQVFRDFEPWLVVTIGSTFRM